MASLCRNIKPLSIHSSINNGIRCFSTNINKTSIADLTASEFRDIIGKDGRAYIVYNENTNKFSASNASLSKLIETFSEKDISIPLSRDFDFHEGFFIEIGKETNAIHGAFVHKTKRGPGAGGVRYWTYDNVEQYLCDGLRLSRGYILYIIFQIHYLLVINFIEWAVKMHYQDCGGVVVKV